MTTKDIHSKPFDEATQTKLELLRIYFSSWLPVFIAHGRLVWNKVNIFDFFAGPGETTSHDDGSPKVFVDVLEDFRAHLVRRNTEVNLYLNELKKDKFENLKNVAKSDLAKVHFLNKEFTEAFNEWSPSLLNDPSFVFLDQNGIKEVNEDIFKTLLSAKRADFMMFLSSSTLARFCDHPFVKKYINISKEKIKSSDYFHIHRILTEYYRELAGNKVYISSFSLKKGANIYGIIFGSKHILGLEKFLTACWKIDKIRGEANFDIDRDNIDPRAPHLFPSMDRPKKLDLLERDLMSAITAGEVPANEEKAIKEFALTRGCLPKHAKDIVRKNYKNVKIK